MSLLKIYSDTDPENAETFENFEDIRSRLAEIGLTFERWSVAEYPAAEATPEEVQSLYQNYIEAFKKERGFLTSDVVAIHPGTPNHEVARKKFLDEHTHSEDEARFFVDGSGLFCIHKNNKVYQIVCERDDLINVPAGTTHWFDMGPEPFFKALRFFNNEAGWVANFTGDPIASKFPRYEAPAFR